MKRSFYEYSYAWVEKKNIIHSTGSKVLLIVVGEAKFYVIGFWQNKWNYHCTAERNKQQHDPAVIPPINFADKN